MRRSAAPSALRQKTPSQGARPSFNDAPKERVPPLSLTNNDNCTPGHTRSTSRILSLLNCNDDELKDEDLDDCLNFSTSTLPARPAADRLPSVQLPNPSIKFTEEPILQPGSDDDEKRIYEAVYRKMQTKKHKTWEGDGKVEVTGRCVVLKDENGKELGRNQKVKDDIILEEGTQLVISGKEVQFLGLISKTAMSAKRKSDSKAADQSQPKKKFQLEREKDESEDWYLEMPKPNSKHQLVFNEKGLTVNTVSVDGFLAKNLREHQREGIRFMYQCVLGMKGPDPKQHHGVLLADEMGLGKTIQCIALFWTLLKQNVYGRDPAVKKLLIVTPSSLVRNWDKEIMYWLKLNRIQVYVVGEKKTLKEYRRQRLYPVVIVSYETLVKNIDEALQVPWDLVICDEAHRIKNAQTKTSQVLRRLKCSKRIILTGSPCQNNLMEYFELLDFANPGILGSRKEFQSHFAGPIERGNMADASEECREFGEERKEELRRLTSLFVLGRPAEINIQYLPPKQDLVVFCPLTPLQKEMYAAAIEYYWGDADVRKEMDINISSCNALCAITNLRQICSHPELLLPKPGQSELGESNALRSLMKPIYQKDSVSKFTHKSGKLVVVSGILEFLAEANEIKIKSGRRNQIDRVLIVSYFTETLNILEKTCREMQLKYSRIDGSVPQADRMKLVTDFNNPNSDRFVMLLSAKAGGTGLNFDGASRVILFDLDWNPANDAQSLARVWRGKQKRPVITYRLLTSGTVEEKVFQRQIQKTSYNPNKKSKSSISFTKDELKDLFSYYPEEEENNLTHEILNCTCPCDGTNVTEEQSDDLGTLEESFEDDKLECRFPRINELALWQHVNRGMANPQLLEDLNLSLVSQWVLFIFRSQLLGGK